MRKFIGLILCIGFIAVCNASTDNDVGHKYKSELVDLAAFDVAILPESYSQVYVNIESLTRIPVKITNVKPSKSVSVFRRARDAL